MRHLNAVVNTPELRDAYNANLPKVIEFYTDLAQDLRLYAQVSRAARHRPRYAALDAAQRKLVDNELRDFQLGGAELADADKARFKARAGGAGRAVRRSFEEQPARRDQRVGATTARTRPSSPACPPTCVAEARAAAQADGQARAGSSRCACRATCR